MKGLIKLVDIVDNLRQIFPKKDTGRIVSQELYLGLGNGRFLKYSNRGKVLTNERAREVYNMRFNLYVRA